MLVTVAAGGTTTEDLRVEYQPSGIVQGRVTVTGLPPDIQVNRGVTVCRAEETFELHCPSWTFDAFFGDEGYSLSLLPGDWRIAAAYNDGRDVIAPPVVFHLDGGETVTLDLEVAFDPTLGPPPPPQPVPSNPRRCRRSPRRPPHRSRHPAPSVVAPPSPPEPQAGRATKPLAFTGSSTTPLVAIAVAMVGLGVLCVALTHRRRAEIDLTVLD